ncbi:MAG TPA: endolytic transglycosylase MltG, partial [Micavibrio sp.]
KAGEYEFAPSISMRAVLFKLTHGDIVQRRMTIPEGRTSWQIVQIINAADGMTGTIRDIPKEGSLLPETYSFARDADRSGIISDMSKAMENAVAELWPNRAEGLPFDTPDQAITLASVVEKETGMASERARIAGVFINRLKRGMPLQSDPTVIYALTKGIVKEDGMGPLGRRLLRKDMDETESPYNTYKYPGLPPGPIANPGRAAIEAVLHPEQNDYLYFVADGKGGHVFAATLAEHERNAAEWRQIRKEQGN